MHAIALTLLLLPYVLARMWQPVKAATKIEVVDISPYLPLLTPASAKKAGGGGGGGDRSPTPGVERRHPQVCQGAACAARGGNSQPQRRSFRLRLHCWGRRN